MKTPQIWAVVPAAGIGQRMQADCPKQYLMLDQQTIIEHTLARLVAHPKICGVVVALNQDDQLFTQLAIAKHSKITTVIGGGERADSVLAALAVLPESSWALVHDAARPCVHMQDISRLIDSQSEFPQGAILAMPVRDTMKRAQAGQQGQANCIRETVDREQLWHALTPQFFPAQALKNNIAQALQAKARITDEASAMEWAGIAPGLVSGRADNIKITHPEDLPIARLFLQAQEQATG